MNKFVSSESAMINENKLRCFELNLNYLSPCELSDKESLLKSGTKKIHPPLYWVPLGVCDSVQNRHILGCLAATHF